MNCSRQTGTSAHRVGPAPCQLFVDRAHTIQHGPVQWACITQRRVILSLVHIEWTWAHTTPNTRVGLFETDWNQFTQGGPGTRPTLCEPSTPSTRVDLFDIQTGPMSPYRMGHFIHSGPGPHRVGLSLVHTEWAGGHTKQSARVGLFTQTGSSPHKLDLSLVHKKWSWALITQNEHRPAPLRVPEWNCSTQTIQGGPGPQRMGPVHTEWVWAHTKQSGPFTTERTRFTQSGSCLGAWPIPYKEFS